MESYRTIVSLAKIKELRKEGDYAGAYELAKDVNIKKVREITDLNMLSDVCTESGDFERSIEACEKVCKKKTSRHALSSLVYLYIKTGNAEKANEKLAKYETVAPKDSTRLIYRYRIQKLEKAPYPERIKTLEAWKSEEYTERWALELAKLYHKAGEDDKCIDECNSIISWFEEGEYVEWAKALKAHLLGEIDVREATEDELRRAAGGRASELIPDPGETTFITPVDPEAYAENADPAGETGYTEETEVSADTADSCTAAEEGGAADGGTPVIETDTIGDYIAAGEAGAINGYTAAEAADLTGSYKDGATEGYAVRDSEENPVLQEPEVQAAADPDDFNLTASLAETVAMVCAEENGGNAEVYGETDAAVTAPGEKLSGDEVHEVKPDDDEYVQTAIFFDANGAAEIVPESELPDPKRSEEDIAVMQNIMQYLEENSSATVKLRDENRTDPDICGALGKKIADGEAVLEDYFGNYARIDGVRKQLIRSLNVLFDPAKRGGSIIITGGRKTGKTTLAKKIAKTLNKFRITESKKALIVSAPKLNGVNLLDQKEKLKGCTVIVEEAEKLSEKSVRDILTFSSKHAENSLVFLEGDRVGMNELMRLYPQIGGVFNNRIHLPAEYTVDELKGFVYEEFAQSEYELETPADNLIDAKLEKIMALKPESPIDSAIAIAKSAMEAAEARNSEALAAMMKKGHIENTDIMTIKAEDI